MKAAQFNKYGDTSIIEINPNAATPSLSPKQILVTVHAAGINPVDSAIRNGYMQQMLPLTFPANLGGDYAGVVTKIGEEVTDYKVGDEVYGLGSPFKGGSGTVAEEAAVSTDFAFLKPTTLDYVNAASLPLVGTSAIQALEEHINLESGQKILIHGGAGGIGTLAIQIAKELGAYVATTVSTDDIDFVKSLGADEVINYKIEDFTQVVKDYDAVFDTVGGETTNKSLAVLKNGGVLVTMAGQPDEERAAKQNIKVVRQMSHGTTTQLRKLKELVDTGKVKPVVDSVFTLDEAKKAYDLLENGHPKGKVVIKIKE